MINSFHFHWLVDNLPGIGEVADKLNLDQCLLFDVQQAKELVHDVSNFLQKLTHPQMGVQTVEFLDLKNEEKLKKWIMAIFSLSSQKQSNQNP